MDSRAERALFRLMGAMIASRRRRGVIRQKIKVGKIWPSGTPERRHYVR